MKIMKQHGYLRGCRLAHDRVTVRPGYKRNIEEQSKKGQNKDNCGIQPPGGCRAGRCNAEAAPLPRFGTAPETPKPLN